MIKSAQEKINKEKNTRKGFTLVELLIVIAIIAVLATVVALLINPLEITRRGRDATRLSDLANLQQAILVAIEEATTSGVVCNNGALPSVCTGSSDGGGLSGDGSGWVKVILANQPTVSINSLPQDPAFSSDPTNFHYRYCGEYNITASTQNFVIVANLESAQQVGKETTDGLNDGFYQAGTKPTLFGAVGCTTF